MRLLVLLLLHLFKLLVLCLYVLRLLVLLLLLLPMERVVVATAGHHISHLEHEHTELSSHLGLKGCCLCCG